MSLSMVNVLQVRLDVRKLSLVLSVQSLVWDAAVIYVSEGQALVLHVDLQNEAGTLTMYIPTQIE